MKKLVIVAVIAVMAYAGIRVFRSGGAGQEPAAVTDGEQLALDRLWVDHMPRNERDVFNLFAAITDEPIGIFQTTSVWKGSFEMFRYEANGQEMRLVFPQDNSREKVKTKARACTDSGWDYCMELEGSSRGVKRYYSRKGWELDSVQRADQLRDRIQLLTAPAAE